MDPRYVILEVSVKGDGNESFMTHAGEELLYVLPPGPPITYEFFWNGKVLPPWETKTNEETLPRDKGVNNGGVAISDDYRKVTVPPGHLIRINSTLLHKNNTQDGEEAKAWIILRPLSGPASLLVHPHAADAPIGSFRKSTEVKQRFEKEDIPFIRQFSKDELAKMDVGNFLLLASGVSEKLTLHRKRAELPVEKLAAQCELNKAYVSRLERRELTNVSIPTLLDLAEPIDADISELVSATDWVASWQEDTTGETRKTVAGPLPPREKFGRKRERAHYLHSSIITLKPGDPVEPFKSSSNFDNLTSVIVVEGEVIFRFETNRKPERELLVANQVFHARHNLDFEAQALAASKLLVIRYSGECSCIPKSDIEGVIKK
jgi:transcriptional regulator with XRE-family HTH domain